MSDAVHQAKAGMNARKAEDEAAKRSTRSPSAPAILMQPCALSSTSSARTRKSSDFMDSIKESLGKAGEAVKEAAEDAKDNVKQGVENVKARM